MHVWEIFFFVLFCVLLSSRFLVEEDGRVKGGEYAGPLCDPGPEMLF